MMRNRLLLWIRDQSGHSRRTILDRFPIVVGKTDLDHLLLARQASAVIEFVRVAKIPESQLGLALL